MIPVTSFAGKTRRGLRPRRQRPRDRARRSPAGGADRRRLGRQRRRGRRGARRPASPIGDLARRRLARASPRWSWRPGVPLTHPEPHWTVQARRGGRHRDHRRHRAVLPRAAAQRARRAVRRHHRHQRQVDDHGADRPSPRRRPAATSQLGGNIGTAILSLEPPRDRPLPRHRVLVVPDRPCAEPRPDRRRPPQPHARPSRPARHDRPPTPRSRSGWSPASATAVIAVDDDWCQAIADRVERAGRQRHPRLGAAAARRRRLCRGRRRSSSPTDGASTPVAGLAGIGSLRGAHNAQNAAAAVAVGRAPRPRRRRDRRAACRAFAGLPHRMEEVGRRGRVLFVNDSKATNADAAAKALAELRRASTGSPAAGRRRAASTASRRFFPRIAKAYLIGEAAEEFAATLGDDVPHDDLRHARRRRSPPPPPMPPTTRAASRWCSCRRPARPTTSSRISSSAATPSARSSLQLDGVTARGEAA